MRKEPRRNSHIALALSAAVVFSGLIACINLRRSQRIDHQLSRQIAEIDRGPESARYGTRVASEAPTPSQRRKRLAAIARVQGRALHRSAGSKEWVVAAPLVEVRAGDHIRTKDDGTVLLAFRDGSLIRIRNQSSLSMDRLNQYVTDVRFGIGLFEGWIRHKLEKKFRIVTPSSIGTVTGFDFQLRVAVGDDGTSTWDLFEGILTVEDNFGKETNLLAGQRLVVRPNEDAMKPVPLNIRMIRTDGSIKEIEGRSLPGLVTLPQRTGGSGPAAPQAALGKQEAALQAVSTMTVDLLGLEAPEPPSVLLEGLEEFFDTFAE